MSFSGVTGKQNGGGAGTELWGLLEPDSGPVPHNSSSGTLNEPPGCSVPQFPHL